MQKYRSEEENKLFFFSVNNWGDLLLSPLLHAYEGPPFLVREAPFFWEEAPERPARWAEFLAREGRHHLPRGRSFWQEGRRSWVGASFLARSLATSGAVNGQGRGGALSLVRGAVPGQRGAVSGQRGAVLDHRGTALAKGARTGQTGAVHGQKGAVLR